MSWRLKEARWFWSISCRDTAPATWSRGRAVRPRPAREFFRRLETGVPQLSAIIITKDEAANIGDCLDSLAFCDERIVVDAASSDGTMMIAKQKGARIATHGWKGFGPQKNYALSLAQGEWVLSIDADERVTPELAQAIRVAIEDANVDGYQIPRRSSFCGRMLRHSGWFPDRVLRLFRRGRGHFTDDVVHERVVCEA